MGGFDQDEIDVLKIIDAWRMHSNYPNALDEARQAMIEIKMRVRKETWAELRGFGGD